MFRADEVRLSVTREHRVARQVEQKKISRAATGEEGLDLLADAVPGLVDDRGPHVEVADVGVAEDRCELHGLIGRGAERLVFHVLVRAGGHQQCFACGLHGVR